VLGHELGVLAQAVAGALDLNDDGVMQEPIEERGWASAASNGGFAGAGRCASSVNSGDSATRTRTHNPTTTSTTDARNGIRQPHAP
jgi:hypothetical protein